MHIILKRLHMFKPEGAEILGSNINDHSRVCKKMAIGEEKLGSFFGL